MLDSFSSSSQLDDAGEGGLESSRSSTSFMASRTSRWLRWLLLPQRDRRVASSATSPSSRGLPSQARAAAARQEALVDHVCRESNHQSISTAICGVAWLEELPAGTGQAELPHPHLHFKSKTSRFS